MHGCLKWCYYLWSCYVCTGVSVILSRIRNLFYEDNHRLLYINIAAFRSAVVRADLLFQVVELAV